MQCGGVCVTFNVAELDYNLCDLNLSDELMDNCVVDLLRHWRGGVSTFGLS